MQNNYVLMTDDSCDLPQEFLKENDIAVIQLMFSLDSKQYYAYDMAPTEFYAKVRSGLMPITAQVNVEHAMECMEPYLKEGRDLLYIVFSSGLSGTYNSARIASEELAQKYPDNRIVVVDGLCASMGQGLLVYHALQHKNQGMSLDELASWVVDNRLRVCHNFTVDDLMHLHRGGRVSKASAIAGSMLGIKPTLHVDNGGKLVALGKVRGRKQSLNWLVDHMGECMGDAKNDIFMVSHGDCLEDAQYVVEQVQKRFGIQRYMIHYVGTVIGTHSGPGTVALFFMGDKR